MRFVDIIRATPGLSRALIYTPDRAADPYVHDTPGPALAAELYFQELSALEAALGRDGHLQALAALPDLTDANTTQQAMLARGFPIAGPGPQTARACTYLVSYEGAAEDLNLWLDHYISHHPPIMARFPGIREIEVCTRIDWRSFLSWPRANHMLRNKVVFDSAEALAAALASSVRQAMREDFHRFPPFSGPVTHCPMATLTVVP